VGDVEQRGRLAAPAVFGEDPGGEGDRHLVAGERHQLGAEFDVQCVQRGVQQRVGRSGH